VCGKDKSWIFLLVGVDYWGQDYLYGLADVIRVIRFDFVNKTMNMIAIPRDAIIEMPEGTFLIESPMKINQAYLTGTAGWTGKIGEGNGAITLAQAIDYNFGIASEHYMVVNFDAVENIIDAIGGVEVDLPEPVYDEAWGGFPSGVQLLDGERALDLMRIRAAYSDEFRIENQTLVLKALFNKLKRPEMLLKIPELVNQFSENVLTDLNPETMINIGTCLLTKFDINNLKDFQIDHELLFSDSVYIPSLGGNSFVYRWNDQTVQFVHNALMQK
nr:LCP family protein [Anaerolineaceae bacterium]